MGSAIVRWWLSRRLGTSPSPQNGPPPLDDVSTRRSDGERRPRLARAAPRGRNISRTNEYQADLPQGRRLDECETDRSEQ